MTREQLRRALISYTAQLEFSEQRMDKPRSSARHSARGSEARPKDLVAVFEALLPLLDRNEVTPPSE